MKHARVPTRVILLRDIDLMLISIREGINELLGSLERSFNADL